MVVGSITNLDNGSQLTRYPSRSRHCLADSEGLIHIDATEAASPAAFFVTASAIALSSHFPRNAVRFGTIQAPIKSQKYGRDDTTEGSYA